MIRYALTPITPEYYEQAFQLYKLCWMQEKINRDGMWQEQEEQRRRLRSFKNNKADIILTDEEPVGLIEMTEKPESLHLCEICILPHNRNKGIGRQVITDLQHRAMQLGKALTLKVHKANSRAQDLYHELGFRSVGESKSGQSFNLSWSPQPVGQTWPPTQCAGGRTDYASLKTGRRILLLLPAP
ncbi:MAG TPA: GNAT family N-acetyltransferase [Alphaproteobacteria bacterium]